MRQAILSQVGWEGQEHLKQARVLLIGMGGLGSPTALYLAGAGVGTLGLVDYDRVDLSNLHRQIIHSTSAIGVSKIESAAESIHSVNPHVNLELHNSILSESNALEIISKFDIVVDGTDNFTTRYLVNDACVLAGKPNIYGSIFQFDGQATVFCLPDGPCYRCLFPEPPPPGTVPSCAEGGVLGVLPGLIGLIQATETIKAILKIGNSLKGRLLLYDALAMSFQEFRIKKNPSCPVCGSHPTITEVKAITDMCDLPVPQILCSELEELIESGSDFYLIDVREPSEYSEGHISGSHLIPLGTLATVLDKIPKVPIVIHCQSGVRSLRACYILGQAGIPNVRNLAGGIEAWLSHQQSRQQP